MGKCVYERINPKKAGMAISEKKKEKKTSNKEIL